MKKIFSFLLQKWVLETLSKKSKEKLKEYARNSYYLKNGKAKSKKYYKNNKNGFKNKHKIVTEIFLNKKKTKSKTKEVDIKICLKKIKKISKECGKRYPYAKKILL